MADPYTITRADVLAGTIANEATVVGTSPGGAVMDGNNDTVVIDLGNGNGDGDGGDGNGGSLWLGGTRRNRARDGQT